MYKVLYIGFLTFQLISVFCNLKSSKKDILEAHNSRKFNIMVNSNPRIPFVTQESPFVNESPVL